MSIGGSVAELQRSALTPTWLGSAGLGRDAVGYIATTGFGRYSLPERDIQITEITSAARGAHFLMPNSGTVLDVGNQSTRAISVTPEGKVRAFKTNDKCAAGSGSFIVRAVKYLEIALEDAGDLALQGVNPQPISSVCAVLAESEIINHVSAGVSVDNILRGMVRALEERLKVNVHVPQDCQYVCALGAALLGLWRVEAAAA